MAFANQEEVERAVDLFTLASTFGVVVNSKWFDDIAEKVIARSAERLPPEVIEAAKSRGQSRDLWETAVELLDELEKLGWDKSYN